MQCKCRPKHGVSFSWFFLSEKRMTEDFGKQVVDKNPAVKNEADVGAAAAVDWNDRFDSQFEIGRFPKNAGVDRAGGEACHAAVFVGRQVEFDEGYHVLEGRREADVLHLLLEVRQAVFDRESPLKLVGIVGACWEALSQNAGNGQRLQEV